MAKQNHGGTGFQPVTEFRTYRRNLPHWVQPESFYFITFRTSKNAFLPEEARDIIIKSIRFHNGKKYNLYACAVIPDHVHLIAQPLEKERGSFYGLAEIMHSTKSFSSKEIKKLLKNTGKMPVPPSIWLDENFDRIIRDEKEYLEKMNYIMYNSVRKGLAKRPEDYRWVYLKDLIG